MWFWDDDDACYCWGCKTLLIIYHTMQCEDNDDWWLQSQLMILHDWWCLHFLSCMVVYRRYYLWIDFVTKWSYCLKTYHDYVSIASFSIDCVHLIYHVFSAEQQAPDCWPDCMVAHDRCIYFLIWQSVLCVSLHVIIKNTETSISKHTSTLFFVVSLLSRMGWLWQLIMLTCN